MTTETARGKRDRAILALLMGCGLRRAELVGLKKEDFQLREDHWVVADLIGKGKHIRTVPVPAWAKREIDEWTNAAGVGDGPIFRGAEQMNDTELDQVLDTWEAPARPPSLREGLRRGFRVPNGGDSPARSDEC